MTVGTSLDLRELFSPRSIAVIGASNRENSVGATLFRNVLRGGYQGAVYPVNPSWTSVSGVRCYPTVDKLPESPELGVVIVPAAGVPRTVEQLGRAGAKGVIIISAGFREVGGAGAELEAQVVKVARRYRMSVVGPNCFGLLNTDPAVGLNATFSDDLPRRGNIAFVSQSGALCAGILEYGNAERIGFSRFVSVGNRAGVDENDILRSLGEDSATAVILLYVESLANGRRFLEVAREVTEIKPVLVIKSGRTVAGERAAVSHTGSLARSGQDQLFDALFQQSGVLRLESIGDLFRSVKMFSTGLRLNGPRLAILTNSGGPGILAADAAIRGGLELPLPSEKTRATLASILSPSAALGNPVDMTADAGPDLTAHAAKTLLAPPGVDGLLLIATPTGQLAGDGAARAMLEAREETKKPVVACLFGLTDLSSQVSVLETHGIPTYTFPEEAVQGLADLVQYQKWKLRPHTKVRRFPVDRAAVRATIRAARKAHLSVLPEYLGRSLLTAYGIRFPDVARVRTIDEAVRVAKRIRYPVVLKVASPDISHKTDVGGVALGIEDEQSLRDAWDQMGRSLREHAPKARIEGYEIEAQIRRGKEVIVGLQRDPNFGPIVLFGMGGIYVEVLHDVTFRLAPLRALSAEHMVAAVKAFPLLKGVRGEPPSDLPALYEVLQRVSQLSIDVPEVSELDVNPLIVRPAGDGAVAVDARVVLGPPSK